MALRNPLLLLLAVVLFSSSGCAPSMKTEEIELPKARRGALAVVVKSGNEDVTAGDISRVKELLDQSFTKFGYERVSASSGRPGLKSVRIVVTKFAHESPSDNGCVTTGIVCTDVCPCVAPCLLLPGYSHPRFDITADVTATRNGAEVFSKTLSEQSVSSANLINGGDENFRKNIEAMTVNNFAATITRSIDSR